jgi:hypothetical protein
MYIFVEYSDCNKNYFTAFVYIVERFRLHTKHFRYLQTNSCSFMNAIFLTFCIYILYDLFYCNMQICNFLLLMHSHVKFLTHLKVANMAEHKTVYILLLLITCLNNIDVAVIYIIALLCDRLYYIYIYIYAVYFTAVAVSPPPFPALPFYNNLPQRCPFLPLLPLYLLSTPSRPASFTLLLRCPFYCFPWPSRLVRRICVSKPY